MKLDWENVSVEHQCYEFNLLDLTYRIEYDLGHKLWNLRQIVPSIHHCFDQTVGSIEEAEDKIIDQLKKRVPVVEKELSKAKDYIASSC